MAIRKDIQQLIVSIDSKESAQYKKSVDRSKELNKTIKNAEVGTEEYNEALREQIELNKQLAKSDASKLSLKNIRDRRRELIKLQEILPAVTFAEAGFEKELKQVNMQMRDAIGRTRATGQAMGRFERTMKTIGPTVVAFFAVDRIVQFFGSIVRGTRELDGVQNRFQTVFGEASVLVEQFAQDTAIALGLTENEYKKVTAATGDLLVPIGFQREQAALLSKDITETAAALALWEGGQRSTEEITKILNKALLGEREQLKELGVSIQEADVKQRLAAKGQENLTGNALKQAKALATLEIITENSADAITQFGEKQESVGQVLGRASALVRTYWDRLIQFVAPTFATIISFGEQFLITLTRGEAATGRFGVAINLLVGVLRILGNGLSFIYNLGVDTVEWIGRFIERAREITFVNNIFIGISKGLNLIYQSIVNTTAVVSGFRAAAVQAFENFKNRIEVTLLSLKIFSKEAQQLITFGDADDKLEEEIKALESKKEQAQKAGKSIGEAFNEGFKDGLTQSNSSGSPAAAPTRIFQSNFSTITPDTSDQAGGSGQDRSTAAVASIGRLQGGVSTDPKFNIRARTSDDRIKDLEAELDRELLVKEKAFVEQLISEADYNQDVYDLQIEAFDKKLQLLASNGYQETQLYRDIERQKIDAQKKRQEEEIKNEERLAKVKEAVNREAIENYRSSIDIGIELLAKDEAARKKNASAIKAFETARVLSNSYGEISGIYKSTADWGPLGWITATARAALVAIRAGSQISSIRRQKFKKGMSMQDLFNFGGLIQGPSHEQGGVPFILNGRNVEAEGGETMINAKSSRMFGPLLSAINSYNGWGVKFAKGGPVNPNTTPSSIPGVDVGSNNNALQDAISSMTNMLGAVASALNNFPTESTISYSSLSRASSDVNTVDNLSRFN